MNKEIDRSAPSLPVSKLLEIDKVCRQFEAAWKAGNQPRVDDFLASVPETQRGELQRELESIDAEYRKPAKPEAFDPYHQWLGIPPKDQPPDHYRLLGVERFEKNLDVIDNAAEQRTMHLRTFQLSKYHDLSERLLNEVAAAKVCLLQPAKKAAYDAKLREKLQSAPATPLAPRGRGAGGAETPLSPGGRGAGSEGAVPPTPKAAPKNRLGEYQLLAKLGSGGMGTVYKARHTKLEKLVALKVLAKGSLVDAEAVARFEREMKAVGQLNHPNIVQALDAREIAGTRFLVMEYVDGPNLAKLVDACGPLPVADACELVRQAALGLDHAHQHGLVHRDIKPANLMLTAPLAGTMQSMVSGRGAGGEGDQPQVKILDLGLAMFQPGQLSGAERITASGQTMGTVDYMAPEQAESSRTVDIRADLYSLGCTLYKLLSGHAPFSGPKYPDEVSKLLAHARESVPPIRKLRPDVPAELAALLDRLLAKDPAGRFATPAELVQAIAPFASGAKLTALLARAGAVPASNVVPPPVVVAVSHTHIETLSNIKSQSRSISPLARRGREAGGEGLRLKGLLPPRIRAPGWGIAAAGAGAALTLLAIILYVNTNHGLVKIELSDPKAKVEVKVDGDVIDIAGLKEPLRLKAGGHDLLVTSGDYQSVSKSFSVRRGAQEVLRVTLEPNPAGLATTSGKASPSNLATSLKEISVELGGGVTLAMILIPAGEFMMGSPDSENDAGDGETPQHRVRITKPFYLGKYLV
jgi:serine/threonine protein kinase